MGCLVWLLASSCTDAPPTGRGRRAGASLQLTADVAGTPVSTLVVQVSAADISPALVFNLETANGVASGTLTIPPGTARTIDVRAFDSTGTPTHEGQTTIDVKAGANPSVTVELFPFAGSQPIDVHIGSLIVVVSPGRDSARVGQTVPLTVAITDLLGNTVTVDSTAIRWASFDTRLATVDTKGNVTGVDSGDVQIVASYAGAAGGASVTVLPSPLIAAAGDIANDSSTTWVETVHFDSMTATMLDTMPGTVLPLGDNVYEVGSFYEYTNRYPWGRHKSRSHPVPGNHEYIADTSKVTRAAGYFDYWGPQAGLPADSGYYSYDLGAWHLIALNSEPRISPTLPEITWLAQDLAATKAKCVLAYWHRPRYSSGQHGNNADVQAFWDTLYKYGADVVLNGHDHDYERFAPQDPNANADPARGIREFVLGIGGAHQRGLGTLQPNSEIFMASDSVSAAKATHGVLRMVLKETGYSWKFITTAGVVKDSGSGDCH